MNLSALTFEEIPDSPNMSSRQVCVEDEALGLPLDIDRPYWREPLVFIHTPTRFSTIRPAVRIREPVPERITFAV